MLSFLIQSETLIHEATSLSKDIYWIFCCSSGIATCIFAATTVLHPNLPIVYRKAWSIVTSVCCLFEAQYYVQDIKQNSVRR